MMVSIKAKKEISYKPKNDDGSFISMIYPTITIGDEVATSPSIEHVLDKQND